jgi:hypothetical protein
MSEKKRRTMMIIVGRCHECEAEVMLMQRNKVPMQDIWTYEQCGGDISFARLRELRLRRWRV